MAGENWEQQKLREAALTRSYITPAVISLLLFFLLWIPGLIASLAYLSQARSDQKLIGRPPQGMGCLYQVLAVFVGIPTLVFVLVLFAHH